jgi:DNA-binding IclR family transcriptional regulator
MPETPWQVLDLLLASKRPCPVAEIITEIGSAAAVADALDTLRASGLVGRAGALVFVTNAPDTRRS